MTDTLKIEAGKEYLLRNGWRMRCYATDGGGDQPIHGAYFDDGVGAWLVTEWTCSGGWMNDSERTDRDIISEAPKSIEVDTLCWVDDAGNHWPEFEISPYGTKGVAKKRVRFTVQHGEGL